MLKTPTKELSGRLELDGDFPQSRGITDFCKHSLVPKALPRRIIPPELLELTASEEDDEGARTDISKGRGAKRKLQPITEFWRMCLGVLAVIVVCVG